MARSLVRERSDARFIRLQDLDARLDGVIVVHSTALGPGAGGCRLWQYPTIDDAFDDALRLAEGMSYKNAMAGLPFGGAKAVLRRPTGSYDRAALFQAFGKAVEELGGQYVTAEDVGTTIDDMEHVARSTRHVAGRRAKFGKAGGDPSPWTAQGVFDALDAAARHAFMSGFEGISVAIQGVGNVGAELARRLAEAGARLVIADINRDRCEELRKELGARIVDPDDIALVDTDIFAPCALGGVLTRKVASALKAKVVCGGANNQLATSDVAAVLMERGVTYVPDYVANAGGIISVAAEYLAENEASVSARVHQIGGRVARILTEASCKKQSPAYVADRMAERIMDGTEAPGG